MKFMKLLIPVLICFLFATSTPAQDISKKEYILGNTLLTLYHEFGHGLVSELELPVLGKEEDAVDTFSVIAITDKFYSPDYTDAQADELQTYLWVTADAWLAYSELEELDEGSYAGEHSLDLQRFYSHVCLVYGSDAEYQQDFVADLDVDLELVEGCEERFELAYGDWQYLLSNAETDKNNTKISFRFEPSASKKHKQYLKWLKNWSWLKDFETSMQKHVALPRPIEIIFRSCDDENAYWDPETQEVVFCYELMDLYANFYEETEN